MVKISLVVVLLVTMLVGCSTTGTLGMVTKSSADPASLLKTNQGYEELGPAEGKACRHLILAIIPFGQSDMAKAVDKALETTSGDALLNVSAESSLYGFIPIYNIYSFTCTTVKGTAIKFK